MSKPLSDLTTSHLGGICELFEWLKFRGLRKPSKDPALTTKGSTQIAEVTRRERVGAPGRGAPASPVRLRLGRLL